VRRQIFVVVILLMAGTAAFLAISHAGGLVGVQWKQIGPAPEEVDGDHGTMGVGPNSGEIQDIAIDPRTADQTIFVATEEGGIWKSTDGGTSWGTTTDSLISLSMGAVTLDAGNPSIVYAGTGNTAQTGFFSGVGVYVSTDGGLNWSLPLGNAALVAHGIARMASPAPNTLLVGTNPGFLGNGSFVNNGVYRSPDFGATFTKTLSGQIDDLAVDTTAANTAIAAVDSTGLFVSTDGGQTWGPNLWTVSNGSPLSVVNFTPGFIRFGQSTKPDHNTIYASVQNTNALAVAPFWGLFVSADDGATWTQTTATGVAPANFGYTQPVSVEPNLASTVYLGFVNLFKSVDGGATFALADQPGGNLKVHNDWHVLNFSPTPPPSGNTPLFVGTDGGIATTANGGTSWTNINGGAAGLSLATSLIRGFDIGRGGSFNNRFSYGGMQDTGTAGFRSGDSPTTWHQGNFAGDGVAAAVDVGNPFHAIGGADGCPKFTFNGGNLWTPAGGLVDTLSHTDGMPAFADGQIDAFDPNNGSNAYISVNSVSAGPRAACIPMNGPTTFALWNSTDGGMNYALMQSFFAQVNAIATTKLDSNTIWVGLNDGSLAFTTDALMGVSATWTSVPAQVAQSVTAVVIDPTNTKTVVVTYAGFGSHVFRTTDGGATFSDLSAALPNLPVNAVVIDPSTTPHTIVVGNDAGVLQTADLGATWQVLGVGMPTVDVVSLALDSTATPELLRAGTFGRSVFELAAATTGLIKVDADLNFGPLCGGEQATRPVEVFNVGVADLHISSFTRVSGSPDFTIFPSPSTPLTISPDAHVDFTIQFHPTVLGPQTATFQINSDDPFTPAFQVVATGSEGSGTVQLTGSGAFGSTICAGPNRPTQTIKVNNVGTCNLHLINAFPTCPDFTLVNPPTFPVPISPDSGIDLTVQFTPTSAGLKACTLEVVTDDPVNPTEFLPLTATTPTGPTELTFPAGLTFPPTVVQQSAACSATLGVPVVNSGSCPVTIASVKLNHLSATPADYSLTGVPGLPLNLGAGEELGAGNLDVVFAPFTLARTSTGTVDVDFENDPITHTFTTVSVPFCGEATHRGIRVLVTQGGVPVPKVKRIFLQTANGPEQDGGIFQLPRTIKNALLQTVSGTPPCPSFQFHGEFGGASNPFQLKDGTYRIKVQIKVGKKTKTKIVRVNIDQCTFTQNVVVAF
jgi:hypothetical protein